MTPASSFQVPNRVLQNALADVAELGLVAEAVLQEVDELVDVLDGHAVLLVRGDDRRLDLALARLGEELFRLGIVAGLGQLGILGLERRGECRGSRETASRSTATAAVSAATFGFRRHHR